jgi:hypothetical protein
MHFGFKDLVPLEEFLNFNFALFFMWKACKDLEFGSIDNWPFPTKKPNIK